MRKREEDNRVLQPQELRELSTLGEGSSYRILETERADRVVDSRAALLQEFYSTAQIPLAGRRAESSFVSNKTKGKL